MNIRKNQSGYMMEVPLILAGVLIVLALLLPALLKYPMLARILVVLVAIVVVLALYYMIVTPGWQPGHNKRLRRPYNIILFSFITVFIIFLVVLFFSRY